MKASEEKKEVDCAYCALREICTEKSNRIATSDRLQNVAYDIFTALKGNLDQ